MSLRPFVLPLALLTLAVPGTADALIYFGNPQLGFRVDRLQGDLVGGSVFLDRVRVHYCGGGHTDVPVGQSVDPVDGYEVTLRGGDLCAVTWYWSGPMTLEGGSSAPFTIEVDDAETTGVLAEEIDPVPLGDWSVVSGALSGGGPLVFTTME